MDAKILTQTKRTQLLEQVESISKRKITEDDFPLLDRLISNLGDAFRNQELDKSDIAIINRSFGEDFLKNTLQGYSLRKPQGYAGDYLIIDRIYTYHHSEVEKFKIWDQYSHTHASLKAVRNRKKYFKAKIKHRINSATSSFDLLDVASGPARDVKELYEEINNSNKLKVTCVDLDSDAINYAKTLNENNLDKIDFINANVLRFRTDKKYDVVWSAGLFDYFNDKAFIMLLSRFKDFVKPGGEIIIGNFNERNNPSRDFMEIMGEWYLQHRTEEQLVSLAMKAGFEFHQVNIGREKENVNLFLHIMC